MNLAKYHTDWKQHHGSRVSVDGVVYTITASFYDAIFPYPHKTCQIYANVVGKDECYDLLDLTDFCFDLSFKVLDALGVTEQQIKDGKY